MKIYEKPSVDVKTFDVQDVINASGIDNYGVVSDSNTAFDAIESGVTKSGVVFQW